MNAIKVILVIAVPVLGLAFFGIDARYHQPKTDEMYFSEGLEYSMAVFSEGSKMKYVGNVPAGIYDVKFEDLNGQGYEFSHVRFHKEDSVIWAETAHHNLEPAVYIQLINVMTSQEIFMTISFDVEADIDNWGDDF